MFHPQDWNLSDTVVKMQLHLIALFMQQHFLQFIFDKLEHAHDQPEATVKAGLD